MCLIWTSSESRSSLESCLLHMADGTTQEAVRQVIATVPDYSATHEGDDLNGHRSLSVHVHPLCGGPEEPIQDAQLYVHAVVLKAGLIDFPVAPVGATEMTAAHLALWLRSNAQLASRA